MGQYAILTVPWRVQNHTTASFQKNTNTGIYVAGHGSQCIPDCLNSSATALLRGALFQPRMHKKLLIGRAPLGPAHSALIVLLDLGEETQDREETQRDLVIYLIEELTTVRQSKFILRYCASAGDVCRAISTLR